MILLALLWLPVAAFCCFFVAFCSFLLLLNFLMLPCFSFGSPSLLPCFSLAALLLLPCCPLLLPCCSLAVPLLFPYCFSNVERASRSLIRQVPFPRGDSVPKQAPKKHPKRHQKAHSHRPSVFQLFLVAFGWSSGALLAAAFCCFLLFFAAFRCFSLLFDAFRCFLLLFVAF